MSKFKWDFRGKYIAHLLLIVATLFVGYYIGNSILNFAGEYSLIKMFAWFSVVLFLADNIWENVLGV